ncbi:LOW QUALITY PROTEIN: serine/threonine-protein kinase pim-1-like [Ammospiza maritima maritima]
MSQLEDVVSSIKSLEVQGLFPQKQRAGRSGREFRRLRSSSSASLDRPAHAASRKAPVGGSGPCPALPGPPRSRLRQAPPGLAVAPLHESGEEFLPLAVLGQHRPLAPPAFPVRAPPSVSSAAGPEPPVPGAFVWPGQNGESAVPPARAEKPPLEQLYREGPLLGSGGGGSVYSRTRLADGVPGAIKRVCRERISEWARLHKGALVPLELALLWMVSWPGFRGVVRLLDWFEVPEGFALVMERPERCQELWYFLHERGFLTEPVARGLFGPVLEAGRHSAAAAAASCIKAENVLVHLATGEAKLIDFGCGAILQDTFYTRMPGMPEYSPPEWILFGCYHGQPATIWSLGILLYELVCGHLPFHPSEDIIWGQLSFPPQMSQECQHLIRWCLSMDPTDRPSLEDLFEHS